MGVPELNLIAALGYARATFHGNIGSGSTTTVIQLADLDLGTADMSGNLALLAPGAMGANSPAQVVSIQSNTSTSITVPALSAVPLAGYGISIYAVATIQATVAQNIATVGGVPQTGSDWTTYFEAWTDSVGSAGATAPARVVQIGGSDGTLLRVLQTDSAGRVYVSARSEISGTTADGSGTIAASGVSQQVFAANTSRRYLLVQNPLSASTQGIVAAESLFMSFGAAATIGSPSIELAPGDIFTMEDGFVSSAAVNVTAATQGHKFTALEGS